VIAQSTASDPQVLGSRVGDVNDNAQEVIMTRSTRPARSARSVRSPRTPYAGRGAARRGIVSGSADVVLAVAWPPALLR
jgi:hypothetical protein